MSLRSGDGRGSSRRSGLCGVDESVHRLGGAAAVGDRKDENAQPGNCRTLKPSPCGAAKNAGHVRVTHGYT